MRSPSPHSVMCSFDADTLRCVRCGFLAQALPYYRVCKTLEETARELVESHATNRVRVPAVPVGDAAAAVLKTIGITRERAKAVLGKDCGCAQRQDSLNGLGAALSLTVQKVVNKILNAAIPHPVDDDEVAAVANGLAKQSGTNPGLLEWAANAHRAGTTPPSP